MKNTTKTAVHFGAGNIGRGFIGATLQQAGYRVIFADVNNDLLKKMHNQGGYRVHIAGHPGETEFYENYQVLNSQIDRNQLTKAIAEADLVTTSVGASVLPYIAPAIALGAEARERKEKLIVMACENAVNATDQLAEEIAKHSSMTEQLSFCNTAVDRIVPQQQEGSEPDVIVEQFSEWVIETKNLKNKLDITGAKFVKNLQPYIERKLFTVNTAHCSVAYLGFRKGFVNTGDALKDPEIKKQLLAVLAETSKALEIRHKLDPAEQQKYIDTTVARLENPLLNDSIERVGRDPMRKLSMTERIVSPASTLAENSIAPTALLLIYGCALRFENEGDASAVKMHELLLSKSPGEVVREISNIQPDHPLFDYLVGVVDVVQSKTRSTQ
ncbi:MAG: mannitol-1-phosphate 5-dehydrogenase [Microbacteriaceae bacterium]|jgi:mannitol-1-phosphate 5-dehydrogenase|nr:mannitol-1-phosphate 5-dehydrogenase [Microbacteriaceae bacterium]MDR9444426.1 mannitol-1-phosphate 5-dehydrogenase [Microbacteriaceae bacterium]